MLSIDFVLDIDKSLDNKFNIVVCYPVSSLCNSKEMALLKSVKSYCDNEKVVLHRTFVEYLLKTNAIVFIILCLINRVSFHRCRTITIGKISLFDYVHFLSKLVN